MQESEIMAALPPLPEGAMFKPAKLEKISMPHPYVITPRHVAIAADKYSGLLGVEAIEGAEKEGVGCGWRGDRLESRCQLPYKKHDQPLTLFVEVPKDGQRDLNSIQGLGKWLCETKELGLGIEGFAFPASS